jgi:hypothetical protein
MLMGAFMWGAFMWGLSCGRDCRLGLALRRQESLGFECSHAALPSSGHRLAIRHRAPRRASNFGKWT